MERSEDVRPDVRILSFPRTVPPQRHHGPWNGATTAGTGTRRGGRPRRRRRNGRGPGRPHTCRRRFARGRVEVAVPLQVVALGAGVHQGESSDPQTVLAGVVGSGRQPEGIDIENSGQAPFVDPRGLVTAPVLFSLVQSRDDEGLVVDCDERPDAVRGDHLGAADRTTPRKVVCGCRTGRAGPSAAGGGWGHRVPSMKRAVSASTSRRLHSVGHASASCDSSSYAFRSEGVRLPL